MVPRALVLLFFTNPRFPTESLLIFIFIFTEIR
jgi:hypothetical protein